MSIDNNNYYYFVNMSNGYLEFVLYVNKSIEDVYSELNKDFPKQFLVNISEEDYYELLLLQVEQ